MRNDDEDYSTGEVAEAFGLRAQQVAILVDRGTIPGYRRAGCDRRVPHDELVALLRSDPEYRPIIARLLAVRRRRSTPRAAVAAGVAR